MATKKNQAKDVPQFSTGLPSLDGTLQGLLAGDNVVFQVDHLDDYKPFVDPFVSWAAREGKGINYFRFANHAPMVARAGHVKVHTFDPDEGFEPFVGRMLDVIEQEGPRALYVFDCLSELAVDWYSDRMLGNFFMITCPFLFKLDTITYFALFKKHHSVHATDAIHQTAQVILDVHRHMDRLFIHPLKVDKRHSPTLYMLHSWDRDGFHPVTNSTTASQILTQVPQPWLDFSIHRPGVWLGAVERARKTREAQHDGLATKQEVQESFQRLLGMAFTREDRFIRLARRYFDLADLVSVMQRMIGTGLIGGKSLGMLLARAILRRNCPSVCDRLEPHDSFYVGTDVFYTYLVQNGCWDIRRKSGDLAAVREKADDTRRKILAGEFPSHIKHQFSEMLDYFGQSPIIVRSSSLLEDSYGNAFSGKYETVFCANQGTPQDRLQAFMSAVRTIYASTLSEDALTYRAQRGLLNRDEQMSLLVQRVSGSLYDTTFFPQMAGAGFSFNPYVWEKGIDPNAGMVRIVFGLGTRAVDRTGDDYTRIVALNDPMRRPAAAHDDERRFSQRFVDLLDLPTNRFASAEFSEIAPRLSGHMDLERFARREETGNRTYWFLDFDKILSDSSLAKDLQKILKTLHDAYEHPVDVEFTVNFQADGSHLINVLQCRPFQVKLSGGGTPQKPPATAAKNDVLLRSCGPIIGQGCAMPLDRIVYVVPSVYGKLATSDRHEVARTIGRLNRLSAEAMKRPTIMLVGPGRWATSMPELGVPVSFSEINTASVVCEVASMREGLVPDLSLGTHFFNDLVELDMLYLAVFPEKQGHLINPDLLARAPNRLTKLLSDATGLAHVIRVVDAADLPAGTAIRLYADTVKQEAVCYLDRAVK